MRAAVLGLLLSLPASADLLSPALRIEERGDDRIALVVEGTSDMPADAAAWGPVVEVEFFFAPLVPMPGAQPVEGRAVSLGFARGRIVSDAVADNPPSIEVRPFAVAGRFSGLYRARLAFDPARQSLGLRRRHSLPAATGVAEARLGNPGEFAVQARAARKEAADDAATVRKRSDDLLALWERWGSTPRPEGWARELAAWRERLDFLPARNDRRPGHAIVDTLPAAKSALATGFDALSALADACDRAMALPVDGRLASSEVAAASSRAHEALSALDGAVGRRDAIPDPEEAQAALATIRGIPAELKAWHESWREGKPGHGVAEWPAARAGFEGRVTAAVFDAGRASPLSSYADLAWIAKFLVEDVTSAPGRNPSLLSAYASRILKETAAPVEADFPEFERALGRVEKSLEQK